MADRERLRSVAEKIQIGDAEEGAESLEEMISLARDEGRADVRRELATLNMQAENNAALERFAQKYPQLKDGNVLVDAAKRTGAPHRR